MGRRRCCCECWTAGDDFTGSNAAGAGWGSKWDASNALCNLDTNRGKLESGYVLFNERLPDSRGACIIQLDLVDCQDNDIWEIRFGWNNASNYLAVQIEVDGTDLIQRIKSTADAGWYSDDVEQTAGCGTDQRSAPSAGGTQNIIVTYNRSMVQISGTIVLSGGIVHWLCRDVPATPANRIALAHGGGPRAIYFDNLDLSDHYANNRICPYYGCPCTQ